MDDKIVWIRSDLPEDYNDRKSIVSSALEAGFTDIIIREDDEQLKHLGRFNAIVYKNGCYSMNGEKIGEEIKITSSKDQDFAATLAGKLANVVISTENWRVIPLENLITVFQKTDTNLIVSSSNPDDAKLFLETMEVGSDGVLINISDADEVSKFSFLIENNESVCLNEVKITKIETLGIGDRVCVDTCSLMEIGEGMLVGSQSSCLFLVASESMESEYVASRPFRVNAGAVHAYVMTSSGRTKYLSEIGSGDELLAVKSDGRARKVNVGRAKVEKRPLLLIEGEYKNKKHSIVLQNAETIRLCTKNSTVSVSELKVGDCVLAKIEEGGRHFGRVIDETIVEL